MWELETLIESATNDRLKINDRWVAARPLNFTKEFTSPIQRLKWAWEVFRGRAESFKWPEGQ